MLRTSPLLSGACGWEGLSSTLKGLFDLWLEDVIRIKIERWTNLHARAASVDIALQRGEGNGLRHRAGMTLPRAPFEPLVPPPPGPGRAAVPAAALFSRRRRSRGAAQHLLLERENARERDRQAENGGGENPAKGLGRIRSRQHRARRHPARHRRAGEHDRAEGGDDERRAERTKEIHRAGGDAELVERDRILHHHNREWERRPHSEPY